MEIKVCSKCKRGKYLTEYYTQKGGKLGHTAMCKECQVERQKQYYLSHKEKIVAYRKEYRAKNIEKIRYDNIERMRIYRAQNPELRNEQQRIYREKQKALKKNND